MAEMMNKGALLGQLRDEGFSQVLVNRMRDLLEVFGGNVEQFVGASEGQLLAAYMKAHQGASLKSLGKETYKAHERMRQLYWASRKAASDLAKETAKAEAAEAAKREAAKNEALERVVEFETLLNAIAAMSTLKLKSASLSQILSMYDMAKGGAQ